jgi:hypothetical protein
MLSVSSLGLIALVPWVGALIELCQDAIARLG